MMHELGLCEGIVDAVQRRALGRQVTHVKVRVGVLHRVVEGAFQQAFAHAAAGTEVERAALDIVVVPVRSVCRSCRAEFESEDLTTVCAMCGAVDVDVVGGEQLVLESIEYDGADSERL